MTICTLLKRARFTMAALSSALCYFTYSFMEPILAQRLVEFNLNTMQIGWFFALWPIFYIPASILVQYVPNYIEKRVTIILSALMSCVAFIFVGPSMILELPNSLVLMGLGQALVGIFTATMMIPGLPEMVESTLPHFPGQETTVNDLSSGIFNAFLGFGQVLAPMYGSTSKKMLGFRLTCDIVALICLVFGVMYFFIGDGIEAFQTTVKNIKQLGDDDNFVEVSNTSYDKKTELDKERTNTSITIPVPQSLVVSRIRHRHTSSMMSDALSQTPAGRSRITSAAWGL